MDRPKKRGICAECFIEATITARGTIWGHRNNDGNVCNGRALTKDEAEALGIRVRTASGSGKGTAPRPPVVRPPARSAPPRSGDTLHEAGAGRRKGFRTEGNERWKERMGDVHGYDKLTGEALVERWQVLPSNMMKQANVAGVGGGAQNMNTKASVPEYAEKSYYLRRRTVMGPVDKGGTGALVTLRPGQERPSLELALRRAMGQAR